MKCINNLSGISVVTESKKEKVYFLKNFIYDRIYIEDLLSKTQQTIKMVKH